MYTKGDTVVKNLSLSETKKMPIFALGAFSALTLFGWHHEGHPSFENVCLKPLAITRIIILLMHCEWTAK